MYIEPKNSIIKIYNYIPLDNTYTNTLYFNNVADQNKFFHGADGVGYLKYTIAHNSYQRVERGYMRVSIEAEKLYGCNYIAFQNTSFGTKWFYAFITSVEYVNNETSEIGFEIDVMQTYLSVTPNACFIEREHSYSDVVGENLQPESVDLGEYVLDDLTSPIDMELCVVVATSGYDSEFWGKFKPQPPHIVGNIVSGVKYRGYDLTDDGINLLKTYINDISVNEALISVFLAPKKYVWADNVFSQHSCDINETNHKGITEFAFTLPKNISTIKSDISGSNVTPTNKKLLTYPYNFLYATNLQGGTAEYPYEFFNDDECTFNSMGDVSATPMVLIYPQNYKGIADNYDEKILIQGFPQTSVSVDEYKAWLTQNAPAFALTGLSALVGVGTALQGYHIAEGSDAAALGVERSAIGGLGSVLNIMSQAYKLSLTPSKLQGTINGTGLCAMNLLNCKFGCKHIREEQLHIIDNYFSMYGYTTRRVKRPNRNVRKHWTYTKTVNCSASGEAPADDIARICAIYDKGITFWNNANEVGDYSEQMMRDNTPHDYM